MEEKRRHTEQMKKKREQYSVLLRAAPTESKQERKLIRKMRNVEEIMEYLQDHPSQEISIYSMAVQRCSDLRNPDAISRIIQILQKKKIKFDKIFCSRVLDCLCTWEKFELQKLYFEQWFSKERKQSEEDGQLIPDAIVCSIMIKGCAKRGDLKQALSYLQLMIEEYNIQPNVIISMLNVYAKCGNVAKMMDILNYSQRPDEHFVAINEMSCTTIMSGFLKANKVKAMFDFYEHQIPELALRNVINMKHKPMLALKSIGHLQMLDILHADQTDTLRFHHEQFLNTFHTEMYPKVQSKSTTPISIKDVENLMISYILLHKRHWMDAVKDIEMTIFQNPKYMRLLNFWDKSTTNQQQTVLHLYRTPTIATTFLLRYLMTFQRNELNAHFKDGPIKITFAKLQYANKLKTDRFNKYELSKKKSIEHELNKWKVPIRLEPDKENPMIYCLNQSDVSLFFQTVPLGTDCLQSSISNN
ncbi:hypothetical protein RFI_03836 [Reticulomyxa filosa]|uniref:Pentacotripeptide-repeat region of PRORP domain-containing protein n=1 Tax=Reticulomyxa filosa TaxID=46433 RepID=X6P503_RETFI|nr:hypothetical protein RFI_03836 [Reticulomyxa filosa]|eukprot:ETO33271.1 hypothetical protein RFI_03836 [Reticulomyxa filosa]